MEPFYLKDSALIAIATGKRAQNLRELKELLFEIDVNSIYYHFWGGLLRPRFDNPEYHNDFAIWVAHSLHNKALAERLAVLDPVLFDALDDLRKELISIIEEGLEDMEFPEWSKRDDQFEFIYSKMVVFKSSIIVKHPSEFVDLLPEMSAGSIFYHVIDARRRNSSGVDDFQNWLLQCGEEYGELRARLLRIDPYFSSLTALRKAFAEAFAGHFERESLGS